MSGAVPVAQAKRKQPIDQVVMRSAAIEKVPYKIIAIRWMRVISDQRGMRCQRIRFVHVAVFRHNSEER